MSLAVISADGSASTRRLRILLVGHACGPGLGSEPGLTWNWAKHIAVSHDVWVVAHPQHRAAVETAMREAGGRSPRLVWVDVAKHLDPWDPVRGERGIHLHYLLWQRAAFAAAQRLHEAQPFDIVHHVSWGTVNAAPELWRLNAPFVWGPLGGGQAAPLRFSGYLSRRGVLTETARAVRAGLAPLVPSLRRAARHSAVILATNRETARVLYRAGARHVELFLDNGVSPDQLIPHQRVRHQGDRLELLWAGRIEARKALTLALEALARAQDAAVRLTVAGDGPLRQACERRAMTLGVSQRVRFIGKVPHAAMRDLFATSDALLFTSLQDGFGSVVIEALAAGLPVIALDHQGVGAMIPREAAIKVPITSPSRTVAGLAEAIRTLREFPDLGQRMTEAARSHAATETWDRRAARLNEIYRRCLEASNPAPPISRGRRDGAVLPQAAR